jgi:hypothetical protein
MSFGQGLSYVGAAQDVCVGGFTGISFEPIIANCYALGDVFVCAVSEAGTVNGGGFAGWLYNSASNCFAKGNVIAQRNSAGTINAGGFAGSLRGGEKNTALGESVTATGGDPNKRNIGRIFGDQPVTGTAANNRAYNGMRLYQSATYGDGKPEEITTLDPTPAANNKNGANANLGDFRTRSFWTNLGFTTANWDHVTVDSRGYPILRESENGRAMGGQL